MSCPEEEHWSESKNYCIQDFPDVVTGEAEKDVDVVLHEESIRSKPFEDKNGDRHVIRVGCRKGEWNEETRDCGGSMKATQLLHPKKERSCDMTDDC